MSDWYSKYRARALVRTGISAGVMRNFYTEQTEGVTTRESNGGSVDWAGSLTVSGGALASTTGTTVTTSVGHVFSAVVAGQNASHIINPKTESWYSVHRCKFTSAATYVSQTTMLGGISFGAGSFAMAGFYGPTSTTKFSAVWGATQNAALTSAIDVDATLPHTFELWHNVAAGLVYLSVDDEPPVSAANTVMQATTAQWAWRTGVGTENPVANAHTGLWDSAVLFFQGAA